MNKCEVYDVATDTWTQVASLNTRRNFHTTIAFDNACLYVIAGFNGGQRTNLIEKYDIRRGNGARLNSATNMNGSNSAN